MSKKSFMLTSVFLLWGVAAGMVSPAQTSINAKLRVAVDSPFLASLISFAIGTLLLVLIILIMEHRLKFDLRIIPKSRWWIWIGGPLGVIFVTSNILLLPILGAELTVTAILCGQMMIALIIDHFGWFGVTQHKINWQRIVGFALMITGIVLIQHF
ncbi:DMT family transporter [Sporolactobacillus pectinivorans]|uniref:DMT family transporter n=1 Tax=Sporolactobacillus pectinivorans TaxID=1591408 RepID=UPI000C25CFE8|nr:DMT family transporter [Sporolactobacillus pectinivorans]